MSSGEKPLVFTRSRIKNWLQVINNDLQTSPPKARFAVF